MRILSNSTKFSASRPLLPTYNYPATMATTYSTHHLGAVVSKIFGDWKYASPLFGPCLLWPNGWMDQNTTRYGGTPRPRPHCVTWDPAPPSTQTATAAPPRFGPLAPIPAGPHFAHNLYCRLGSARRAALVAVLPDNCHPSSLHEIQCYVVAL